MKRYYLLLVLATTLFILISPIVFSQQITGGTVTGESISGEATQTFSMSINVIVLTPSILLITPKNETYLTGADFLLNFTSSNALYIWYNLDNLENISITGPTILNVSQDGAHTLSLYANNSNGEVTFRKATFIINSTLFTPVYNEYRGSDKGNSTGFYSYSYEELQNLDNIILEKTNSGKIFFNEAINVTNISGNEINIDDYTNISFNRIEINSTALPTFNKPATLTLYDLIFDNPRILKDGESCSSSICAINSYSEETGTLVFNVTGFSVYSSEETPPEAETTSAGGGATSTIKDISINKEKITTTLKQGEAKKETLTIKNIGIKKIKVNLENQNLNNIMKISETEFELEKGESKTIDLIFLADENIMPNIYIGKIIIKTGITKKEIPVYAEVESLDALFDVFVEIPQKWRIVFPGEEIFSNIKIFELKNIGKVDVELEYSIRDNKGNIMASKKETISVEKQGDFVKSLYLPENIKSGDYLFYITVKYDGKIAGASNSFVVEEPSLINLKQIIYIFTGILVIVILIIFYEIRKIKKHIGLHKVSEKDFAKNKLIKKRKPESIFAKAFKRKKW